MMIITATVHNNTFTCCLYFLHCRHMMSPISNWLLFLLLWLIIILYKCKPKLNVIKQSLITTVDMIFWNGPILSNSNKSNLIVIIWWSDLGFSALTTVAFLFYLHFWSVALFAMYSLHYLRLPMNNPIFNICNPCFALQMRPRRHRSIRSVRDPVPIRVVLFCPRSSSTIISPAWRGACR